MDFEKEYRRVDHLCQTQRNSNIYFKGRHNFLTKLQIILARLSAGCISLSGKFNENIRTLNFPAVNADYPFHVWLEYHATDISKFDPGCDPAEDRYLDLESTRTLHVL